MSPLARATAVAVSIALSTAALAACSPAAPAPTPTPTGWASDEEAFAAAEETYRAYIDATNAYFQDPKTVAQPTQFLTGQALEDEIDSVRAYEEAMVRPAGELHLLSIQGVEVQAGRIDIHVCIDVRDSRVVDFNGKDVTPQGRQPFASVLVTAVPDPRGLLLSSVIPSEAPCSE